LPDGVLAAIKANRKKPDKIFIPTFLITLNYFAMKIFFLLLQFFILSIALVAQKTYPIPEYSNEIYLVKKDSSITLARLEKAYSNQQMKVKMMGMGGMDQGYATDGEKSAIRFSIGNLVFLFYNGDPASDSAASSSGDKDSAMKANGMDVKAMAAMSAMYDPTQMISLYNMKAEKGKRKILTQSMGFMGKSKGTATKFSLSIKKVKENYYEMRVDKALSKGEYSFVMMDTGGAGQSYILFAFGID
jgi:hypothetical protein